MLLCFFVCFGAVTIASHSQLLRPQPLNGGVGTSSHAARVHRFPRGVREMVCVKGGKLLSVDACKALVPPRYNKYMAWGFADGSVRFCVLQQSTRHRKIDECLAVHEQLHEGATITCALITDDAQFVLTAGTDGVVNVWRMQKSTKYNKLDLQASLVEHSAPITCLVACLSYRVIVSGAADGTVALWDYNRLLLTRKLPRHPAPITAITVNELSGDIVTCAGAFLFVWSVNGDLIAERHVCTCSPPPAASLLPTTASSTSSAAAFGTATINTSVASPSLAPAPSAGAGASADSKSRLLTRSDFDTDSDAESSGPSASAAAGSSSGSSSSTNSFPLNCVCSSRHVRSGEHTRNAICSVALSRGLDGMGGCGDEAHAVITGHADGSIRFWRLEFANDELAAALAAQEAGSSAAHRLPLPGTIGAGLWGTTKSTADTKQAGAAAAAADPAAKFATMPLPTTSSSSSAAASNSSAAAFATKSPLSPPLVALAGSTPSDALAPAPSDASASSVVLPPPLTLDRAMTGGGSGVPVSTPIAATPQSAMSDTASLSSVNVATPHSNQPPNTTAPASTPAGTLKRPAPTPAPPVPARQGSVPVLAHASSTSTLLPATATASAAVSAAAAARTRSPPEPPIIARIDPSAAASAAPYMRLVQTHAVREPSHSGHAITALHTSASDGKRLWSGDSSGNIIVWSIATDDHWVKDSEVTACKTCGTKFGLATRRHHCRVCGGVFCSACSSKKAPVPALGMLEPVRVCDGCYPALTSTDVF